MTMELKRRWLAGISGAIVLMAGPALAGTASTGSNTEINAKIDALEQQIQDLKASQAAQLAADQRAASAPKNSFNLNNGRPTFTSADGAFSASLRALVQLDGAYYSQSLNPGTTATDLSSGSNFRRARIGLDGKLWNVWEYSFLYDFGGSGVEGSTISNAYLQYDGLGAVKVRAGAFPPFASLEDSAGAADTIFLERASAVEIARGIAGGDGRSAIALFAAEPRYLVSLAYTGGKVGQSGLFDEQQALLGRLAYLVVDSKYAKAVIGVNGTDVFDPADAAAGPKSASSGINFQNAPELRVDATNLVSTGNINSSAAYQWGVDGGANWKNFYAEGGYFGFEANRRGAGTAGSNANFDGWYAEATWVLTGESRRYDSSRAAFRSPKVANPVDGKGGWGAWELAARYSTIDLDDNEGIAGSATPAGGIRGGEQNIWTAGINWYPVDAVRVLLNYQHDEIDRLSGAGAQIGQNVDAVSFRIQISI